MGGMCVCVCVCVCVRVKRKCVWGDVFRVLVPFRTLDFHENLYSGIDIWAKVLPRSIHGMQLLNTRKYLGAQFYFPFTIKFESQALQVQEKKNVLLHRSLLVDFLLLVGLSCSRYCLLSAAQSLEPPKLNTPISGGFDGS